MFVDGERTVTLKGDRIAEEFQAIVDDYVRRRYVARQPSAPDGDPVGDPVGDPDGDSAIGDSVGDPARSTRS